MERQKFPDFKAIYDVWERLPNGSKAELRRVGKPEELIEVPGFYRLFAGRGLSEWEKEKYQRIIYCLPCLSHIEEDVGLGKALAKSNRVGEKRLFQVVRSDAPNDVIQLRRILQMVEPSVNWPKAAKLLWYWNDRSKRDLLEEYFINQPKQ